MAEAPKEVSLTKIWVHIDAEEQRVWFCGLTKDGEYMCFAEKSPRLVLRNIHAERIGICPINEDYVIDIGITLKEPVKLSQIERKYTSALFPD